MTQLVYAATDFLLNQPSVTSLVGENDIGFWIFANTPYATIENTGKAMVVLTVTNGWGANEHNTARFPTLNVDIWADPTRHPDRSVAEQDADVKVEEVYKAIDKFFHLVNASLPGGASVMWGTPEQIATRTGVRINSSSRVNEPEISPALNDDGALIARIRYNVSI